jgi:hypothetical protein
LDAVTKTDKDQKIIDEATKRFKLCQEWESRQRAVADDDVKFVNGDPDNNYQWPNDLRKARELDQQPCLTINKARQHCLQIINDAKQNKPGVKISPVGNGATFEAAQVFGGIVRHIEYTSNAETIYDCATENQVQGGIGYWRVVTEYASDDTFDQDIFLRRIKDPQAVYLDPDIREKDGSDARFGFIFEDMPRAEFVKLYPDCEDEVSHAPLGNSEGWITKDHVRVCEYYSRQNKKDKLVAFMNPNLGDGQGEQEILRLSDLKKTLPQDLIDAILADPETKVREILIDDIKWYKIAANKVIDSRDWPGSYIPIVRLIGEESIIDGVWDCKGHVRYLKDAQRMYNYWSSSATEMVALQPKSPWIAPAKSIEGYETYWQTANKIAHSILPYNDTDDQGNQIAAPSKAPPAVIAPAFINGMSIAQNELMMASGQYQSQMGQNENAKSGVAINARQRQGDNATYHFIDNLAVAIRYTGKILIDLIPKVYDTPRVIKIMAQDGTTSDVAIDPQARQSYLEDQEKTAEEAQVIFNPSVGKYAVISEIGPAYATKRQQAFDALTQIMGNSPELMQVAGDLLFKAADFPMADDLAERLHRMVPKNILGEGPPPEVEQMQQQLQGLQQALQAAIQQLADKDAEQKNRDAETSIKGYEAETKRIGTVANSVPEIGIDALRSVISATVQEMLSAQSLPQEVEEMPMEMQEGGPVGVMEGMEPVEQGIMQ